MNDNGTFGLSSKHVANSVHVISGIYLFSLLAAYVFFGDAGITSVMDIFGPIYIIVLVCWIAYDYFNAKTKK